MSTSQASLASSDTLSVRSHASSRRYLTKIIVVLPSEVKIGIPLNSSMTVAELQREVLRRASILKLPVPEGEFNIRLNSEDGPIAFPEDAVVDVVDVDDKATVWLVPTSNDTVRQLHKIRYCNVANSAGLEFKGRSHLYPLDYACSSIRFPNLIGNSL
jgi:hypothetical protein